MTETQFLRNQMHIQVMKLIHKICEQNNIDQSHGLPHAIQIAIHVKKALDAYLQNHLLDQEQQQNVILAALLHDIDDHKYFKTQNNQNARSILDKILDNQQRKQKILRMIDLVSFSKNGNQIYQIDPIYFYFTRYADRVEAMGLIGLYRTHLYSQRVGTSFYTQNTARPQTKQEIYEVIIGRDKIYMEKGGKSESVIDHMFDKILHIKLPKQIDNSYLGKLYNQGHEYIVDYILEHAKTGYKNGKDDLLERFERWNNQKENNVQISQLIQFVTIN